MKKNSGFTLVEVLVVSVFIIGTLVFLFTQFLNLKKSYDYTLNYNTVEGLYGTKNINNYLNNSSIMIDGIINSVDENKYVDISNCSSTLLIYEDLCTNLYTSLGVKTVIVTYENLNDFNTVLNGNTNYSENLKQYIKKTTVNGYESSYRLIVEFNDDTIASIIMEVSGNA